jgi:hypothetical protein
LCTRIIRNKYHAAAVICILFIDTDIMAGKFLITAQEVKRYEPVTMPESIRGDIQKAIDAKKSA